MTNKILIFDMDGTLLNSMGMWRNIAFDINEDRHTINTLNPMNAANNSMLNNSYNLVQDNFSEFEKNSILALLDKYFFDFYSQTNLLKNNVKTVIETLFTKGYKIYVATATDYKYALAGMKANGIDQYIQKIYTPDTVNFRKRDIRYFEFIVDDLGLDSHDIIFFDDVLYALELAKEIGFTTVAVEDEHAMNVEQIKNISDYYIRDFIEILEIVK